MGARSGNLPNETTFLLSIYNILSKKVQENSKWFDDPKISY